MADEATPQPAEITSFAQFEAAGGKYNAPAETKAAEPAEEPKPSEAEAESALEAETAEEKPAQEKPDRKPPAKADKPKLSLADEHARLLKEVTELRRQRRELQAPARPTTADQPEPTQSPTGTAQAGDDKPPIRPKLSTYQGTLEQYEEEVAKYEEANRVYLERQWERKQQEQQAKSEQQRITQAYGEKLAEHLKEHPEYDAEIAQTPMSPLMVDIVLHEGPQLGQSLIDDKENAKRISQLPRDIQIFEMGRLAAGLNGRTAAEPSDGSAQTTQPQPVKVPARLNATGGSASTVAKPDHGAKSFAQWEEVERRLAQKRR